MLQPLNNIYSLQIRRHQLFNRIFNKNNTCEINNVLNVKISLRKRKLLSKYKVCNKSNKWIKTFYLLIKYFHQENITCGLLAYFVIYFSYSSYFLWIKYELYSYCTCYTYTFTLRKSLLSWKQTFPVDCSSPSTKYVHFTDLCQRHSCILVLILPCDNGR